VMRSNTAKAVLAALVISASMPTAASAGSLMTYDVNANYDRGLGTVTGSFTLNTTTNTSYAVDLTVVGAGGVNSGSLTDPTQFGTGTYEVAPGVFDATYNDGNPALQVFLTYPAGGGALFNGSFGSSSVGSYFSPTCGGEICGFPLSGTVLGTSTVSAVPLPSTWGMMLLALVSLSFMAFRQKLKPALMAARSASICLSRRPIP
jgi:hypothetical protein